MSRSGPASAPTSPAVGTVGHRVTSRSSSPPTNVMAIASVVNHAPAQTPSARSARTNPRGKIVKIGASAVPGHTSTRQSGRRASHQMLQGDGSITNAVWTDPAPQDPAQASIATSSRNQHTVSSTTHYLRISLRQCDMQRADETTCLRSSPMSSLIHQVLDSAKTGLGGSDLWAISTNACT